MVVCRWVFSLGVCLCGSVVFKRLCGVRVFVVCVLLWLWVNCGVFLVSLLVRRFMFSIVNIRGFRFFCVWECLRVCCVWLCTWYVCSCRRVYVFRCLKGLVYRSKNEVSVF